MQTHECIGYNKGEQLNGKFRFDIDEVTKSVCDNCPLIDQTCNGISSGEQIDPPESSCPLEGVPRLKVNDEDLVCEYRQNS